MPQSPRAGYEGFKRSRNTYYISFVFRSARLWLFISVIVIALYCPSGAWSSDECKRNFIDYDVCETARRMADELANALPMRMSQNIMIEKALAIGNVISLTAVLNYDKSFLESHAFRSGVALQELNARMANATKAHVCQDKTPTQSFVRLGGKIQYVYRFADGTPYLSINVDRCI